MRTCSRAGRGLVLTVFVICHEELIKMISVSKAGDGGCGGGGGGRE